MTEIIGSILTIGHSNHPIDRFLALLRQHSVTAVADVRSAPHSRFNPQFNRDYLAQKLRENGVRYVFMGRELGARPEDPGCYENGRVQYARLASRKAFREGIERLVHGARQHQIVCLCAEKEPLECHRALLVARALEEVGVTVTHIHADGQLEPHAAAMERLLDLTGVPRHDLFRTRAELFAEALSRREADVSHVDAQLAAEATELGR